RGVRRASRTGEVSGDRSGTAHMLQQVLGGPASADGPARGYRYRRTLATRNDSARIGKGEIENDASPCRACGGRVDVRPAWKHRAAAFRRGARDHAEIHEQAPQSIAIGWRQLSQANVAQRRPKIVDLRSKLRIGTGWTAQS